MYKIKQLPEDFLVTEESAIKPAKQGKYAYFRLWKREYTTMRAVEHIADFLRIPQKDIGFAGAKDKEALTEQIISVKNGSAKLAETFKSDDIKLTFLGHGDMPISLGDLRGNRFGIVIRNLDRAPAKTDFIINYFDDQRFSTNNAAVGKAILQGRFKEACGLIDEESVNAFLAEEPKNFIGALHTIPFRTLQFYLHAYQSLLFNHAVSEYLQCKYSSGELVSVPYTHGKLVFPLKMPANIRFPLIGFGVEYPDAEIEAIYNRLLEQDSLSERSFVVRAFPELSAEGDVRDMVMMVQDMDIGSLEADDLNTGKKRCVVRFFLPKGSYATLVVKRMMAGPEPHPLRS